jgi:hypothetical protein
LPRANFFQAVGGGSMGIFLRQSGASLRDVIDACLAERKNTLDRPALDLLARLARSSDAAKAFRRLNLKDRRQEAIFLTTCIEASLLARTFAPRIEKAKLMLVRMERLARAVVNLRTFVGELITEQNDPPVFDLLSVRILEPPANVVAMKYGLHLIADRIEANRRVANEDVLRLGATRKSQSRQAGENAAIGWLAEGVRLATGRPHLLAVADLAQVILKTEVSQDRVRNAARARQREWRQPLKKPARSK